MAALRGDGNLLQSSERFESDAWLQRMYVNWTPADVLPDADYAPNETKTADLIRVRGSTSSRLQIITPV